MRLNIQLIKTSNNTSQILTISSKWIVLIKTINSFLINFNLNLLPICISFKTSLHLTTTIKSECDQNKVEETHRKIAQKER